LPKEKVCRLCNQPNSVLPRSDEARFTAVGSFFTVSFNVVVFMRLKSCQVRQRTNTLLFNCLCLSIIPLGYGIAASALFRHGRGRIERQPRLGPLAHFPASCQPAIARSRRRTWSRTIRTRQIQTQAH